MIRSRGLDTVRQPLFLSEVQQWPRKWPTLLARDHRMTRQETHSSHLTRDARESIELSVPCPRSRRIKRRIASASVIGPLANSGESLAPVYPITVE